MTMKAEEKLHKIKVAYRECQQKLMQTLGSNPKCESFNDTRKLLIQMREIVVKGFLTELEAILLDNK